MSEANSRFVDLHHSLATSLTEPTTDNVAVSVCGRHDLDGRSSEGRGVKEDIEGLSRQSREATAKRLVKTLRDP